VTLIDNAVYVKGHRTLGYPMAVFLMIALGVAHYLMFKRRHWL